MKKNYFFYFFFLLIYGCNNKPIRVLQSEIFKITLACENYMGDGSLFALELDSSLNLKYYGGLNSNPTGYYYGNITQNNWNTIEVLLKKINYQNLDSAYPTWLDNRKIEIVIHSKFPIKHFVANASRLPDEFIKLIDQIINTYKNSTLTKTTDSLLFETTVQIFTPQYNQPIYYEKIKPD